VGITDIWTVLILRPMLNALLGLYTLLGGQFWLAIIIFTVVIRILMTPLMLPQQRSAKKMQELQPKLQEIQKKYGKDREKLAQEQMKLYKEAGVNPMGGCLPLLIQFPIWIGLYQSIIQALGYQPLQLLGLSSNIYLWMQDLFGIWSTVPLNRFFLGIYLLDPVQDDGHDHRRRRPGGFDGPEHDADDAPDVRLLQPEFLHRAVLLFYRFQHHRHHYPGFYLRLGGIAVLEGHEFEQPAARWGQASFRVKGRQAG
jgi:uncharacterized membrane protein (DUF106 family)